MPTRPALEPTQVLTLPTEAPTVAADTLQPGVPPAAPQATLAAPRRRPAWLFAVLGGAAFLLLLCMIGIAGLFIVGTQANNNMAASASAAALAVATAPAGTPADPGGGGLVGEQVPGGAGESAAATAAVGTAIAERTAEVRTATAAVQQTAAAATATVIAAATATMQAYFDAGEQVFRDEFVDNRHNWFTGRFNDIETDLIEDGVFKVIWDASGTSYELYDVRELSNFIAEVDCVVYQGGLDGSCGLVFGHTADVGFYKFEVFNDYYRLFTIQADSEPRIMLEGDPLGIVKPNNTNRLRVLREGENITIYLNDVYLDTVADLTFASGKIGVSTTSYRDAPGVEIWFDNFSIWALP